MASSGPASNETSPISSDFTMATTVSGEDHHRKPRLGRARETLTAFRSFSFRRPTTKAPGLRASISHPHFNGTGTVVSTEQEDKHADSPKPPTPQRLSQPTPQRLSQPAPQSLSQPGSPNLLLNSKLGQHWLEIHTPNAQSDLEPTSGTKLATLPVEKMDTGADQESQSSGVAVNTDASTTYSKGKNTATINDWIQRVQPMDMSPHLRSDFAVLSEACGLLQSFDAPDAKSSQRNRVRL